MKISSICDGPGDSPRQLRQENINPALSYSFPLQPIQLPTPSNTYLSNYPPPALWDNMGTNVFVWACPLEIFTKFLLCFEFFSMICILWISFNLHIILWTGDEPSWLNLFKKSLSLTALINCMRSSIRIMLPSSMPMCCWQWWKLPISHQPTFKIGGSDTSCLEDIVWFLEPPIAWFGSLILKVVIVPTPSFHFRI